MRTMSNKLAVPLDSPAGDVDIKLVKLVGGKASSLIKLCDMGLTVPDGYVLTLDFFAPWIDEVSKSRPWMDAINYYQNISAGSKRRRKTFTLDQRKTLEELCENAKEFASLFPLSSIQKKAIDEATAKIGAGPFAVRSSSPEEDLEGASFAGQYESVLDVDRGALTEAIRTCFASCLDHRVLIYKSEMDVPMLSPSIAVIVQNSIQSHTAGVAFSISPITNDYDEVLINASWGQGEGLVGGEITPDTILVDKVKQNMIEYKLGDKGNVRSGERCMSEEQVMEVAESVIKIEASYGLPVDIEFAYDDNGKLFLLQARPITTYVPLPKSMQTDPGARRHLYIDNNMRKAMTISQAITPLSNDVMLCLVKMYLGGILGKPADSINIDGSGFHLASRTYVDVTMFMHLMTGKKISKLSDASDVMISKVLGSQEVIERYSPDEIPAHLTKTNILRHLPRVLWHSRRFVRGLLEAWFRPETFHEKLIQQQKEFDEWSSRPLDTSQSVRDALVQGFNLLGSQSLSTVVPALIVFMKALFGLKSMADSGPTQRQTLIDDLLGGHEGDMVVELGKEMFQMAELLSEDQYDDVDGLTAKLQKRELPADFLSRWDKFTERYGVRGPLEMEIANPKYGEKPELALEQIVSIAKAGDDFDPSEMQSKRIAKRKRAYHELCNDLPARQVKRLKTHYSLYNLFAASREVPKHQILQIYWRVRQLLLQRADEFVKADRIDERDDIFLLHIDDVDMAYKDLTINLRTLIQKRSANYRRLQRHVKHFPLFIDSRGRIVRAPRTDYGKGTVVGSPMSPGVVRGKIKILNHPSEKQVNPGDVLVAVTTDPGWTPLFIVASAILLEVGGELQHGALVAREYGKPCVSGIQDIMNQFCDGQMVEVDGDAGIVRIVGGSDEVDGTY